MKPAIDKFSYLAFIPNNQGNVLMCRALFYLIGVADTAASATLIFINGQSSIAHSAKLLVYSVSNILLVTLPSGVFNS